jgi:Lysine methyltransferase
LELGSGCGLVGLAAGVLGAKEVLLTDLPYALPNMQTNLDHHAELCGHSRMVCQALDWYDPPSWQDLGEIMKPNNNTHWIPEVILVADCVWMQELVGPLFATLQTLAPKDGQSSVNAMRILISYQRRGKSTHEEFWNGLHTRFPNAIVTEVDVSQVGLSKPDVIYLLCLDFGEPTTLVNE